MAYLLAAVTLNPRTHFEGRNPPIPVSVQDNTLSQYNLNDKTPVLERYGTWLSDLAHGSLGKTWAAPPRRDVAASRGPAPRSTRRPAAAWGSAASCCSSAPSSAASSVLRPVPMR